jgi:hypothetical protein
MENRILQNSIKHDTSFIPCWQFVIAFFNSCPVATHLDPGWFDDCSTGGAFGKMTLEILLISPSSVTSATVKSTLSIPCMEPKHITKPVC